MKVLHVITDSERRGAQVFAAGLSTRLQAAGLDSTIVALTAGSGATLDVAALGPSRRSPRTLAALRRAMQRADVTVAHGSSTLVACALAGLGAARPFVYRQISDPVFWTATPARRLRVRLLYRRPAAVVALSDRSARVISERFRVARDRITVIPNAVEPHSSADASPDPDSPGGEPVVLYVGALTREKGVLDLIDAPITRSHRLVLVGDGPLRDEVERRTAAGRVVVAGGRADLGPLYRAADVVVLPSWTEELPAVLLEAGLARRAVVATDVGSVALAVRHEESGLLVPPRDPEALASAIDDLLADHALRKRMGEAARRHVAANFTFDAVVPAWTETIGRAAAAARR